MSKKDIFNIPEDFNPVFANDPYLSICNFLQQLKDQNFAWCGKWEAPLGIPVGPGNLFEVNFNLFIKYEHTVLGSMNIKRNALFAIEICPSKILDALQRIDLYPTELVFSQKVGSNHKFRLKVMIGEKFDAIKFCSLKYDLEKEFMESKKNGK